MAFDSFRDFVNALDKAGELKRISQPVATELEITEIADREMKSPDGGKALLLEQPTANAVVDSVRSIIAPTPAGDWHSVCVCSDGSYGIEKNLICSFPVRGNGQKLEIVQDVPVNEFSRAKIDATVNELKEERAMVADLLPK